MLLIGIDPYPFNLSCLKKNGDLKQLQWWPNQPKCRLKEPYLKSQQQNGDRTQRIIDVQPAKIKEFSQYHRIFCQHVGD
jgi:predicted nucleic-acid-binding Zn-ribbon protein